MYVCLRYTFVMSNYKIKWNRNILDKTGFRRYYVALIEYDLSINSLYPILNAILLKSAFEFISNTDGLHVTRHHLEFLGRVSL